MTEYEMKKRFVERLGRVALALVVSSAMLFSYVAYRGQGLESALFVLGMYALLGGFVTGVTWMMKKIDV